MRKTLVILIIFIAVATAVFASFRMYSAKEKLTEEKPIVENQTNPNLPQNYKDATYKIEGHDITLKNGLSEIEAAPGSASKITTRYFGNELKTDLNNDGREDVVFLITQEQGGSGVFFYAVATLNTVNGYLGSNGYFLGDRIAPQTINLSSNPRQKNVIVVNYADRKPNEPMTTQPSVGKSVYLKLNVETMQWGIVVPDFEGESR